MSRPKRAPREIPFTEIESAFPIVGMYRRKNDTVIQVRWDGPKEFVLDADGTVIVAPRGFAKVYKPGRVDKTELRQAFNRHADQAWYFTFGFGHTLPDGASAKDRYVVIVGTYAGARAEMLARFGNRWSHQYLGGAAAGVDEYGLTQYGETLAAKARS